MPDSIGSSIKLETLVEEFLMNCGANKEDILQLKSTQDGPLLILFDSICKTRFSMAPNYAYADIALISLFPYIVAYFRAINKDATYAIYTKHCKYLSAEGQIQGY
jgi:hypothetical protein